MVKFLSLVIVIVFNNVMKPCIYKMTSGRPYILQQDSVFLHKSKNSSLASGAYPLLLESRFMVTQLSGL